MKWLGVLLLVKAVLSDQMNVDENEGVIDNSLFEGDMLLTAEQRSRAENGEDVDGYSSRKRGASTFRKWPNGVVPYVIDSSLAGNSLAENAINEGMEEWTTKTCIRFTKRTSETAYVIFRNGAGCSSSVGNTRRPQYINLAPGCRRRGTVAHEIGHALGLFHEQSRPDRDTYVTILWQNIQDDKKSNFNKYPRSTIDSLGSPYDYGSIMHYGGKAFSKNMQPTIVVKNSGATIGNRRGLSTIDAQQANLLYQAECARRGPTTLPSTATPLPTTSGNECSSYKVLSSADRSQGNTAQNNVKCDQRDLSTPEWYRFMGAAGDQIPDSCVPIRRCGTHAPGWLNGSHPTVQDGVVTRTVCYHWSNNCCRWSNTIKVKNCGGYFVYELQRTPACSLRYCGNAGAGVILPPTTTTQLPTTGSCQDNHNGCRYWSRFSFYCRFSRFVRANCRKSCRICS